MKNLNLIGEKVIKYDGSKHTVIDFNYKNNPIIKLNDGKLGYDISISIPNNILKFENEKLQLLIEKELFKYNYNNPFEIKTKENILSILDQYGFEGFLHTTELSNFEKIITCGKLFSREKAKNFIDRADPDVIEHTDISILSYCRFYYYFNTPTNFRAKYINPVIMVFDKDLIYNKNIIFYEGNAASHYSKKITNATEALNVNWDAVFERGPYFISKYYQTEEDSKYITRMRNSEFLLKDEVSIENIQKIYFKTQKDCDFAKAFLPQHLIEKTFVNRGKFIDD